MDYNAENPEVKVSWKKRLKKIGLWAWIIVTAFLLLCADVFTQDKATLRESIQKKTEEYRQLETKLQDKSKELKTVKKELTEQLEAAQAELAAAQEALAAAEAGAAELEKAKTDLAAAQEALTAVQADLATSQADVEVARADADGVKAELEAVKTELETVKAELEAACADADGVKAELEAAKAELETVKAELEAALAAEEVVEEVSEEAAEENPAAALLADAANSVTLNVMNGDGRSMLNVKLPADEAGMAVIAEVLGSEDAVSCVLRVVTGSGATAKFTTVEATVEQVKEALGL